MTIAMFSAIIPQLIIALGITLALLLVAWRRTQKTIALFTAVTLLLSLIANIALQSTAVTQVTQLLKVDGYGIFSFSLILISALTALRLSRRYLKANIEVHDEYYILLLLLVLGAGILVISDHFAALFLGFELLSISLVGLVGYGRDDQYSVETGFKYLILSAVASSFMLLGIAFIYSQTGSMSFSHETASALYHHQGLNLFYNLGILLFVSGIAFKLSLVPFHFWTPDVYQGSPTPVTMLMSTVSKVAMFVVLLKCCIAQNYLIQPNFQLFLATIAIASMVIGNTLALRQTDLKRLLAYSSIAHMGYLLIVLMTVSETTIEFTWASALFYLAAYVVANISIFSVITLLQYRSAHDNTGTIKLDQLHGLFWHDRRLAVLIIVSILSLAGIPLTMGFIGKFYVLSQATLAHAWWLISALIIGSGIGLVYYLRVIFALFHQSKSDENNSSKAERLGVDAVLVYSFIIIGLLLGVLPDMVSRYITV
jgi:NADH-quinone oxidoreductase subunit N